MTEKSKEHQAASPRKPRGKAVLYVLIDGQQQDALRALGFMRQVPVADLVREAISEYLRSKGPSAKDVEGAVQLLRRSLKRR